MINAKDFGAIGDGNANLLSSLYATLADAQVDYPKATSLEDSADWAGIQAAIDHAIASEVYRVILPDGKFKTSDTIHVGYGFVGGGANFVGVVLEGVGWSAIAGLHGGTEIHPLFQDRPVINIQGGRQSGVRRLSIIGGGTPFADPHGQSLAWRRDASNYIPAGAFDSPTAPYCGVCIDGYAGGHFAHPAEPDAYPTPRYAPCCGTVSDPYAAAYSSQWFVEDCYIYNTLIGVMCQPYFDSNADFGNLHNTAISFCKVAVAVGNSQARNMDFSNILIDDCHTAFDSASYGHGVGNLQGNWNNLSLNGIYRVLHGNGGWSTPVCISNSYIEVGMILGDFAGGVVTWDSCSFSLPDAMYAGDIVIEWNQEPVFYGRAEFRRCIFIDRNIYHFAGAVSTLHECILRGPTGTTPKLLPGMQKAIELFGRLFIDTDNDTRPGPSPLSGVNTLFGRNYSGVSSEFNSDGYNSMRGRTIWSVGQKDSSGYSYIYDVAPMARFAGQGGGIGPLDGVSRTLTPDGYLAGTSRIGDVLQSLGHAFYYTHAIGPEHVFEMELRALTWFKMIDREYSMFTAADFDYCGASFDPSGLGTAAIYYPAGILDLSPASENGADTLPPAPDGLFMKTVAGSPDVSFINYADDTETAVDRPAELSITSKPLWTGANTRIGGNVVPFPKHTTIRDLTPTADTITMSQNALASGVWLYGPGIKRIH